MERNKTSNNEVRIEYVFNAPRARVFEAWTNPEFLKQWYAPKGCTIHFNKIDIRPGGTFHSCISNPQYGDCWAMGTYIEIIEPEKIVQTLINADEYGNPVNPVDIGMDPDWPKETLLTVTFLEYEGEKTKIILEQTVAESLARQTGAYPSWIEMLQRLNKKLDKEFLSTTK